MRTLFSFFSQPIRSDRVTLVRSIVALRLTILSAGCVLLLTIHLGFRVIPFALLLLSVFLAMGLWSLLTFYKQTLLNLRGAIVRELIIDFVWVFIVVVLTGRSASPFIYYYLVLVAVCAMTLSAQGAWVFCLTGIAAYTFLLFLDVNRHFTHMPEEYRLHLLGMWLNYVGSTLVTCFFITRLTRLLREQHAELANAREDNLKNEQLIGIGTVAASTVHALATPIATLTVLAEDIINDPSVNPAVQQDASLMLTQIDRCKRTMKQLSSLAQNSSGIITLELAELLADLQEHYALNTPASLPHFIYADDLKSLTIRCNALFQYALINLINNAMESGAEKTSITICQQNSLLVFLIKNTSTLSADAITRRWGRPSQSEKRSGLGIGSFLANTTIEKQGGTVELTTSAHPSQPQQTHIVVTVSIPLKQV